VRRTRSGWLYVSLAALATATAAGACGGGSTSSPTTPSLDARPDTTRATPVTRPQLATGPTRVREGVLITDAGKGYGHLPGGLWIASPQGAVERLMGRSAYPVAVAGPRRLAVIRPPGRAPGGGNGFGPITVIDGDRRVALPHSSGPFQCATWSADGSELAYLTGRNTVYRRFPPAPPPATRDYGVGVDGSLWIAKDSALRHPVRVESGLFPECPSWAPHAEALAYLVGRGTHPSAWRLRAWAGEAPRTVARFRSPAPSLGGAATTQSFAWEPGGDALVFLDDGGLFRVATRGGGAPEELASSDGALAPLIEAGVRAVDSRPGASHERDLRLSPDGRHAALGVGAAVGVVALDSGSLTRLIAPGEATLRGWVGSRRILAVAGDRRSLPLSLFPIRGSRSRRLLDGCLGPLVADAAGRWFAYARSSGRVSIWRPAGSVAKAIKLPFHPSAVAAIEKNGRVSGSS
jgi:hypothetical protein